MRYINPEDVVRNHAKNNCIPQWDIAIMCFHSIQKTLNIVNFFSGKKLGYRLFSKCDNNMVFEAEIENKKVGILGWCTGGGPMVASLIEELSVTGVRWLIGIGAAASLEYGLKQNEIILPTELLVNDGLSKSYSDLDTIKINNEMYSIINRVMLARNCAYRQVKGATIEALYRQNEKMLEPLRKRGIQIVNWELTPFYMVSFMCNIRSAWIGHISDIECEGIWRDWFIDRDTITYKVIDICKNIILEIMETSDENKFKSDIRLPG